MISYPRNGNQYRPSRSSCAVLSLSKHSQTLLSRLGQMSVEEMDSNKWSRAVAVTAGGRKAWPATRCSLKPHWRPCCTSVVNVTTSSSVSSPSTRPPGPGSPRTGCRSAAQSAGQRSIARLFSSGPRAGRRRRGRRPAPPTDRCFPGSSRQHRSQKQKI